jgi:hypothetical protein
MNKLLIALFLCILSSHALGQGQQPKIEVRLKMIEQENNKGSKDLALGVSIINHSNSDIYIPHFELFASFGGIHFYQKEGGVWREIDIFTHDYKQLLKCIVTEKDGVRIVADPFSFYSDHNQLTNSYKRSVAQKNAHQDSLFNLYVSQNFAPKDINIVTWYDEKPLFLKAKQQLENYAVFGLDYLLTKKMEYKISFNSEPTDSLRYYRESIAYVGSLGKKELLPYPKSIFGYQVFYPKDILSNTIQFTNNTILVKPDFSYLDEHTQRQ